MTTWSLGEPVRRPSIELLTLRAVSEARLTKTERPLSGPAGSRGSDGRVRLLLRQPSPTTPSSEVRPRRAECLERLGSRIALRRPHRDVRHNIYFEYHMKRCRLGPFNPCPDNEGASGGGKYDIEPHSTSTTRSTDS